MNLLIADPSPLCRAGVMAMLREVDLTVSFVQASDFTTTCAQLAGGDVNIAVLDVDLPGMNDLAGLRTLRARYAHIPMVVTAWSNDCRKALGALAAGAHGYIPKRLAPDDMCHAFHAALRGQIYVPPGVSQAAVPAHRPQAIDGSSLTGRQKQVIRLLAAGKSNKEIARTLDIAEGTVKAHVAAVFRLFGVRNRVSAAAALRGEGMGNLEPLLPGFSTVDHSQPVWLSH